MAKIFLSYRHEDSIDIAGRIYDWLALRMDSGDLFMDVDSIPAGVDFRTYIQGAIRQSRLMLVVIGQKWLPVTNSAGLRRLDDPGDFVRIEVESAIQHNIPIIPLLVQNAPMPAAGQLPPSLAQISYLNAIAVRSGQDFTRDMERVGKGIESFVPSLDLQYPIVRTSGPLAAPALHRPAPARQRRRRPSLPPR